MDADEDRPNAGFRKSENLCGFAALREKILWVAQSRKGAKEDGPDGGFVKS
jgi:hypothetical protein